MLALTQGLMSLGASGGGGGPGAHRYWRILVVESDGAAFVGATAVQFFDALGVDRSTVSPAVDSPFAASSQINTDNRAALAFDNNLTNTGWLSGAAATQWIRVDAQDANAAMPRTSYEVKTVRIYGSWNLPSASPRAFQVQWSDDDSAWTTALTVSGQTGWTANQMREFTVF